jgi:hypothetical protein
MPAFVEVRSFSRRFAPLLVACAAAGILGGCSAGTQLVDMWRDPSAPAQPIHKMLVVAIRRDATSRRIWEDGLVSALEKRGVTATPSYNLFAQAPPDTDEIEAAVRDHNFDGVLSVHRLASTTQSTYVPGYTHLEPVWVKSRWSLDYHTYWTEVHEPGYVETDRIVRHRVDVWNTAEDWRLVWSGTTESVDPSSSRDVNAQIAKLIVPELLHQRIIAR